MEITGSKNNPLNSIQQTCTYGIDIWIKQGFLGKKNNEKDLFSMFSLIWRI